MTDYITLNLGARHYNLELDLKGSTNFANRGDTDLDWGRNIDEILQGKSPSKASDTIYKVNLEWAVTDDALVYSLWSEGYRPGGFNRNGGASATDNPQYVVPDDYESDELTNIEVGWKSEWFDNQLRLNGAAYYIEWSDMQISTLNFDISNITFIDNAGISEIRGMEVSSTWLATENITTYVDISFNDTEFVEAPPQLESSVADIGSPLALAPKLQYSIRARYDLLFKKEYDAYFQFGYQYTDDTYNSLVLEGRFEQDDYSAVDFSAGISRDAWSVSLHAENLTNSRAELYISDEDIVVKKTASRPRTVGITFSYDFF